MFVEAREVGAVGVVGDDEGNASGELVLAVAVEEVREAMQVLRDEDSNAGLAARCVQAPMHEEAAGDGGESGLKGREVEAGLSGIAGVAGVGVAGGAVAGVFELPLDAHEEETLCSVLVLIRVEDICAVRKEQARDGGDKAFAVRAGDEEDGGGDHGWTLMVVECDGRGWSGDKAEAVGEA